MFDPFPFFHGCERTKPQQHIFDALKSCKATPFLSPFCAPQEQEEQQEEVPVSRVFCLSPPPVSVPLYASCLQSCFILFHRYFWTFFFFILNSERGVRINFLVPCRRILYAEYSAAASNKKCCKKNKERWKNRERKEDPWGLNSV